MKAYGKKICGLAALLLGCTLLGGCMGSIIPPAGSSGVSAAAATSAGSAQKAGALSSVTVPYAMNRSMNPFTADSMINLNLWPLLYDCLAEPDGQFTPQMRLAASVRTAGNTVSVSLRSGVQFSDGSPLTSADVVYSIQLAMSNPGCNFYTRVANFASPTANGPYGVTITLKTPDPLAANMLDFPIIKSGSDKNGKPIGSGRYLIKNDGNNRTLTANPRWYGRKTPKVSTITLLDVPDNNAIKNCLSVGELSYVLSDYGAGAMALANTGTSYFNLNQLLFLGVNRNNAALSDADVRRALSMILDRYTMVKEIYSSHALAADEPFNPAINGMPKIANNGAPLLEQAVAELKKAGYTTKNGNGVLIKSSGAHTALEFTLFVNKADSQRCAVAQQIAEEFKNVGIGIKINSTNEATFSAALTKNQFDLYLSEIKITNDMDLSPFFAAGGAASYGSSSNGNSSNTNGASGTFYAQYQKWRSGSVKLGDLPAAFDTETPFIPICYRMGSVSYPVSFFKNIIATNHNIFFNIEDWQ